MCESRINGCKLDLNRTVLELDGYQENRGRSVESSERYKQGSSYWQENNSANVGMKHSFAMSSCLNSEGLSHGIDDQFLKESFTEFGEITEARIVFDHDSGRSRGFGFISFTSDEAAASALKGMDGKQLSGRILHVNYANERRSGYGGGGGYSQNDGYGNGGGSSQSSYSQSQSEYGTSGGFGVNDGHGSGEKNFQKSSVYFVCINKKPGLIIYRF